MPTESSLPSEPSLSDILHPYSHLGDPTTCYLCERKLLLSEDPTNQTIHPTPADDSPQQCNRCGGTVCSSPSCFLNSASNCAACEGLWRVGSQTAVSHSPTHMDPNLGETLQKISSTKKGTKGGVGKHQPGTQNEFSSQKEGQRKRAHGVSRAMDHDSFRPFYGVDALRGSTLDDESDQEEDFVLCGKSRWSSGRRDRFDETNPYFEMLRNTAYGDRLPELCPFVTPDPHSVHSTFCPSRSLLLRIGAYAAGLSNTNMMPVPSSGEHETFEGAKAKDPNNEEDILTGFCKTVQTQGVAMTEERPSPHQDGRILLASDSVGVGSSAKLFTLIARESVSSFILAAHPSRRHFYICPDPYLPCDIALDIDKAVHIPRTLEKIKKNGVLLLDRIIRAIETHLDEQWNARVSSIVILTGCRSEKISFHLHIRLQDQKAFRNLEAAQHFISHLKLHPRSIATEEDLNCIDISLFRKWHALRLPYCSKKENSPKVYMHGEARSDALRFMGTSEINLLLQNETSQTQLPWTKLLEGDSEEAFEHTLITRDPSKEYSFLSKLPAEPDTNEIALISNPPAITPVYWEWFVDIPPGSRTYRLLLTHIRGLHEAMQAIRTPSIRFNIGNPYCYRIKQRNTKYCLYLNRTHRTTYGEFHIFYNDVYFKCWSNDCGDTAMKSFGALPEEMRSVVFPEVPLDDARRLAWPEEAQGESMKDSKESSTTKQHAITSEDQVAEEQSHRVISE